LSHVWVVLILRFPFNLNFSVLSTTVLFINDGVRYPL